MHTPAYQGVQLVQKNDGGLGLLGVVEELMEHSFAFPCRGVRWIYQITKTCDRHKKWPGTEEHAVWPKGHAPFLPQTRNDTLASNTRSQTRNLVTTTIQLAGPLSVRERTLILGKDRAWSHRVERGPGLLAGGLGDGRLASARGSMQENIVS